MGQILKNIKNIYTKINIIKNNINKYTDGKF